MRISGQYLVLGSSLLMPACLAARTQAGYVELRSAANVNPPSGSPSRSEESAPADEAELVRETKLDTVLRLALERNPDLHESQERLGAALERVPAAARLPDLELKYEQWGVPLRRPFALGQAQTLMLGLRQTFPAPGSLDAKSRAALEEAKLALDTRHAREQDIIAQVRRAFYEYYRADREYRIHLEHVDLATRVVELARANYQAGRGSQQDVLRTIVELSRLHNDIAAIEQQRISSRALLNSLMARDPDAPLGPPAEFEPPRQAIRIDKAEQLLESSRPELLAASRASRRSEASLNAAQNTAHWPSFMVGADYWYMPTSDSHHAYGAMFAMSLPWLNPRHREEVREAEHALAADRRALESVRNAARYQLRDAAARYDAAQQSFTIIDRDLLPQARQSYQAGQAAFASGQGDALGLLDALRSYLQVRLERSRALAHLQTALADLERTVGADLSQPRNQKEGQP